MPRLGLLLAALAPTRAWWERHAQDSSVLTLSVPAGDSFVRATQKLAEDCDLQENEAAIVDAFRGRYRFTLGDSAVAPSSDGLGMHAIGRFNESRRRLKSRRTSERCSLTARSQKPWIPSPH